MILKVNRKDILIFFLMVISVIPIYSKIPSLSFLIVVLQTIIIVAEAGVSMVSILCFLINFCLLQEMIAFYGVTEYGLLGISSIPIYYYELCFCCYMLNVATIFILRTTNVLENENKIYKIKFNVSKSMIIVLCLMSLVITFLIFPNSPGNFLRGNTGVIPFEGWSCVPFFLLAVSVLGRKYSTIVYGSVLVVVLCYVSNGERVDAMGLILFLLVWYLKVRKRNALKIIGIGCVFICFILVLVLVGAERNGYSITLVDAIRGIVIQSTAADVTHVFNCSVDLYKSKNEYNGITYLSYLINIIPYLPDPYSFEMKIAKDYPSAGGGLFFAEPVANFGLWFCGVFSFLYLSMIFLLVKRTTVYRAFVYIILFLSIFRTAWYGLHYPMTTILYFVPFVLLLNRIFLSVDLKTCCNQFRYNRLQ